MAREVPAPLGWACPGFFDSHLHLLLGGLSLAQVDLAPTRSREEFESAIACGAAARADAPWLLARGWNDATLGTDGEPDASWLRRAGSRPCVAWRIDQHACVVNDSVIDWLGTALDPYPDALCPRRDGRPIGILREGAAWECLIPRMPQPTTLELCAALTLAQDALLARGITSVGSMEYAAWVDAALAPMQHALAPRMHVTLLDRDWPVDVDAVASRRASQGDRLRFVGCKSFADGTLGSRTAWMHAPYADDPSGGSGAACELTKSGQLADWMKQVVAAGLSPSVHAIGDAALTAVLDAAEAACIPDRTLRIEHAQTVAPADLPRLGRHIISMQPLHKWDDARVAAARLGRARIDRFFPFRRIADCSPLLAFGSDWPIAAPDPIAAMRTAITGIVADNTRFQPHECVTPLEALRATTIDAARSLRTDADLGHLTPGARADITILDRDPLQCDWLHHPPRVIATVVAGELRWNAPSPD